jgi:hypothetical protein
MPAQQGIADCLVIRRTGIMEDRDELDCFRFSCPRIAFIELNAVLFGQVGADAPAF